MPEQVLHGSVELFIRAILGPSVDTGLIRLSALGKAVASVKANERSAEDICASFALGLLRDFEEVLPAAGIEDSDGGKKPCNILKRLSASVFVTKKGLKEAMETKQFRNYNDAIRAALDWLRDQKVQLDEAFEAKMGGFGMRSLDRSGGYRVEFDSQSQAHINVWSHRQKGPHYVFPGNDNAVRSLWRQLYYWDPKLKRRSQQDHKLNSPTDH